MSNEALTSMEAAYWYWRARGKQLRHLWMPRRYIVTWLKRPL